MSQGEMSAAGQNVADAQKAMMSGVGDIAGVTGQVAGNIANKDVNWAGTEI